MQIVYSKHYDIGFFGIERLHPFDSRKYSRAWGLLRREFGATLSKHWLAVDRPVSNEELLLVHSPEYLASLKNSLTVARAVEIPMLRFMPAWLPRWRVLRPMRWAVRGSVLAARSALETGLAVNLSGGYHHAKPSGGEGFCIFSDIALIVRQLRNERMLGPGDRIVYIDLDAHQGNGVCHEFRADDRVQIFDMYNGDIYPRGDSEARRRIDCNLPLSFNTLGASYLRLLQERLPAFLDSATQPQRAALAIYNAGTDVFIRDKLGGLCLSESDVLERDLFVLGQLQCRGIPAVMLLSGGYSPESHRLVAATVSSLLLQKPLPES